MKIIFNNEPINSNIGLINNIHSNEKKIKRRNSKKTISYLSRNNKISFDSSYNTSKEPVNKYKYSKENIYHQNLLLEGKEDLDINIEEYLKTEFDDMDYDDAIKKDDRKFCDYFCDKIKNNQIILNTFFLIEPLKPRTIKIILFILQIDLYLFVNGLFYNEEYISKVFHLKKDTFYDKFQRFIENFFYAALVGIIISYVIEFFFIEEKKIKRIFKREKENLIILKYEITQVAKSIQKRYFYFIITSFVITIFTWFHISCFNNVYPHMKLEWIIFSLIIIVGVQILSFLSCLLESILRFLSFACKSEKIYRLSLLLS